MLSNAYFVAKFRFDTAENEPAKNLQNFRKMHFSKMRAGQQSLGSGGPVGGLLAVPRGGGPSDVPGVPRQHRAYQLN